MRSGPRRPSREIDLAGCEIQASGFPVSSALQETGEGLGWLEGAVGEETPHQPDEG